MPLTIDPAHVDAVIFDMGGIFLLPDPVRVRDGLAQGGVTPPADDDAFHRAHFVAVHAYDHSGDEPETWNAYLDAYLLALGAEAEQLADVAAVVEPIWLDAAHLTWIWTQPDAVAVLQRFAAADQPVAIVSNCDGNAARCLLDREICQVGGGPGVDVPIVVDSHVVGVRKPDPAIFAPALAALDVAPERAIYVGDTVKNDVVGARAAGLHPVHFDPYGLYADAGHDRVRSLWELVEHLG